MQPNFFIPQNTEELNNILSNDIIIIDFFAKWCAPCKIIGPIFEKLSNDFPNATFIKVDVETFADVAKQHSIRNVPTILIIKPNKLTSRLVGFTSEQQLKDFITNNI